MCVCINEKKKNKPYERMYLVGNIYRLTAL